MARTSNGKKAVSIRPNTRKTGGKPLQVRRPTAERLLVDLCLSSFSLDGES